MNDLALWLSFAAAALVIVAGVYMVVSVIRLERLRKRIERQLIALDKHHGP